MTQQKLTVFQKLGNVFGKDGLNPHVKKTNKYSLGNSELLKTQDKGEFEVAKLQAQQNKYLLNQWQKVDGELYQQAIHYETTRIGSYSDFETMEFYPEISATLDIFMEESTTPNDKGDVINVYSGSKRVKRILEDLLINRLDIHTSLPMWTRNLPVREDSIIPLLDGTEVTIKDLSKIIKNGEEVWSYAIQDNTKAIVPSKIIWCDLTRKNSELFRVTFDDGTHIDTTPDHEYMLRDGSFKRADQLSKGQSLMPFYTRKSEKKKDCIDGYEKVYNPSTGKYKFTHSMVSHQCVRDLDYEKSIGCQFDTHHVDFNKLNNDPRNLNRMTHSDHFKLHVKHFDKILGSPEVIKKRMDGIDKYLRSDERKERLSLEMSGIYPKYFEEYNNSELHSEHNLTNWKSGEFIQKTKKGMTIELTDGCLNYISDLIIKSDKFITISKLSKLLKGDDKFIELFKINYRLRKDITKSINKTTLNKNLIRKIGLNYFDYVSSINPSLVLDKGYIKAKSISLGRKKEKVLLNHKVVSVVKLTETSDVYCLEAVGPNGESDRHNFPICSKDSNNQHTRGGVFLSNCKYGDNFVHLNIDQTAGIIGARQLPNFEIERRENDIQGIISQSQLEGVNADEGKNKTRFFWKGRDITFNSWQIAHFRLLGDDRKLPYGTCLKGDTRINTIDGVKEISEIKKGDIVYSFNIKTQSIESSPVLDTINSGKKECFRIGSRHNFVDASKEHKILILENDEFIYKNVLDLKLGDLLVINKNEKTKELIKIDKSKPNDNKNGWSNDMDLFPDYVNEDFAQLFGFLIGDGWVNHTVNTVSFVLGEDEETNEYYINLLKKFSGGNPRVVNNGNQVVLSSKLLSTILERMGFKGKSYEKRLPKWIYNTTPEIQKSLLAGLMDADGWWTKDEWVVGCHIELNNEQLIKDLKILLQRIGYKSGSIRSRVRKSPIIEGREIKNVRESFMITFFDSYLTQMKKYENSNRLLDNYILEPITIIESIGEFETFDIYVENENHNFYANNIVVHNSFLEKARRIWKQLILAEDAMLVYRVTRAPERRVYKIFVGNIDNEDIPAYVDEIANRFKRSPLIDPQTGQMDLRYNQLGIDQDIFVPTRSEDAATPIDTLPGAQNLDQIADIEYLQRKLFTALRVPKTFLGFEEPTGEGKNLALQDIRFSRTINRIQQAMLHELNKIAIIHLYLMGFHDDIDNFTLTLNNPSTQAEMLKIEHTAAKVTLYKDAVADAGNGFGAMSMTRAKREILGWSDDEIKQDLLEQRIEKAAAAELENTANVIKNTGVFDRVDRVYGDMEMAKIGGQVDEEGNAAGESGGSAGGGGGFGGGFDAGELDLGDEEIDTEGEEGLGEIGGEEGLGGPEAGPEDTTTEEGTTKKGRLINETVNKKPKDISTKKYLELLNESVSEDDKNNNEITKIYDKSIKFNDDLNSMINEIDSKLG